MKTIAKETKQKILIVEDEAILAKSLQDTLEEMGYIVTGIADTAIRAIMLFFSDEPDLILMDIHLNGDIDGIRTAEKIQEQKAVPIVYLTANQENSTFERAKIAGALGYVLKPFQTRELQIVIEIALSQFQSNKTISELENSLLNAEKLSTIGVFTSGIIHDIKSPLTLIYQADDILKMTLTENDKDIIHSKVRNSIELIEKGTKSVLNTINSYTDMINTTENETGALISIRDACNNAFLICHYIAIKKNVRFKEINSNKETTVWCGKIALFQVLVNLIKNSCDALENKQDSWIEISWEDLNAEQVALKVTDSGAGIPNEIQEKIFSPLFTTKAPRKGTGLGLNLCKKLLEKFHGTLVLDKDSKNTCFVITLNKNKQK